MLSVCNVTVGSVQHASKSVLSQRSTNVLHVSKPLMTNDSRSLEAKPNSKHSSGICAVLFDIFSVIPYRQCLERYISYILTSILVSSVLCYNCKV